MSPRRSRTVMSPRLYRIRLRFCRELAALVTPTRRTPSIRARNSCVTWNAFGVRAILGHQQPAGEPGLDHVEARAGRRLRELAQMNEDIAVDLALQRRAASELAAEGRGAHSQRRSRALHDRTHRRHVDAERERNPEHAFVSDQADFERGGIVDRHDQRDEAVGGKIDVAEALPGRVEHVGKRELDTSRTRPASGAGRLSAAHRAGDCLRGRVGSVASIVSAAVDETRLSALGVIGARPDPRSRRRKRGPLTANGASVRRHRCPVCAPAHISAQRDESRRRRKKASETYLTT